jgi:hypothetical protein
VQENPIELYTKVNAPFPGQHPGQARSQDIGQLSNLIGQRRQLVGEMEDLHERRLEIMKQLKVTSGDDARVLERIAGQIDQRLSGAEVALSGIERAIAQSTGAEAEVRVDPGIAEKIISQSIAHSEPPRSFPAEFPLVVGGGALLLVAVAVASTIVYVRRVRRETTEAMQRLSADLWGEVKKVSVGVESIAIEVERIGEGQRYVTKQIAEQKVPVERG